ACARAGASWDRGGCTGSAPHGRVYPRAPPGRAGAARLGPVGFAAPRDRPSEPRMPANFFASLLALAALLAPAPVQDTPLIPPDGKPPVRTASGLTYSVLQEGTGPRPQPGMFVRVTYTGWLTDGTMFDCSRYRGGILPFTLGNKEVIPGWDEGIALMNKGAR